MWAYECGSHTGTMCHISHTCYQNQPISISKYFNCRIRVQVLWNNSAHLKATELHNLIVSWPSLYNIYQYLMDSKSRSTCSPRLALQKLFSEPLTFLSESRWLSRHRLMAGRLRNLCSIPRRNKRLFSTSKRPDHHCTTIIQWILGGSFPGNKAAGTWSCSLTSHSA